MGIIIMVAKNSRSKKVPKFIRKICQILEVDIKDMIGPIVLKFNKMAP